MHEELTILLHPLSALHDLNPKEATIYKNVGYFDLLTNKRYLFAALSGTIGYFV